MFMFEVETIKLLHVASTCFGDEAEVTGREIGGHYLFSLNVPSKRLSFPDHTYTEVFSFISGYREALAFFNRENATKL